MSLLASLCCSRVKTSFTDCLLTLYWSAALPIKTLNMSQTNLHLLSIVSKLFCGSAVCFCPGCDTFLHMTNILHWTSMVAPDVVTKTFNTNCSPLLKQALLKSSPNVRCPKLHNRLM